MLAYLLRDIFQYQLIQSHQCECRIARFDAYAVACGNLRD
jgi:hypothetical protein